MVDTIISGTFATGFRVHNVEPESFPVPNNERALKFWEIKAAVNPDGFIDALAALEAKRVPWVEMLLDMFVTK
jgi:hypothetical protein